MPFTDAARNAALDGLAGVITHVSLHSGDPSTTGANELTGGSPAYARKAVSWAASSAGTKASSAGLTFDVAGGLTAIHAGYWSAITAGTFYGYYPLGGQTPQVATIDQATDVFTSFAHGYTNGQQVVLYDIQTAGLVTGFTEGTVYFVVAAATDTFQLSATSGGAAITVTTSMECAVQRVIPESFGSQGTLAIATAALVLDGRFV